ncbi:MAG: glycosyltransferase family 4 protein [Saprospiraceae bacterium]|nr:glycosyltransferase family 4 protein [Saprospiraceae bacterium]
MCKKFPFPLRDGESIAIHNLSTALVGEGCEVSLLAMNTTKHFVDLSKINDQCNHYHEIHTIDVDNRIKVLDAFLNLFTSESYHVSRFVSSEYQKKLSELLLQNRYDIIQLETMYLTPYVKTIRDLSNAKIVLRSHNIEHEIWDRITNNTGSILKKQYLNYLTGKLQKYELKNLNSYDSIITVSSRDLEIFKNLGFKKPGISIPIGLRLDEYPFNKGDLDDSGVRKVCFIGAMDWIPNREGLLWFLKDVWSDLIGIFPFLELNIAGRNTDKDLMNIDIPNCIHHGEVESAISFISSHHIMIVPLLSGSGTRVKILESLALGVPVISTSIGYEGIALNDRKEVLKADTKEEFINAFKEIIDHEVSRNEVVENGRQHVNTYYNHVLSGKKLKQHYEEILSITQS